MRGDYDFHAAVGPCRMCSAQHSTAQHITASASASALVLALGRIPTKRVSFPQAGCAQEGVLVHYAFHALCFLPQKREKESRQEVY